MSLHFRESVISALHPHPVQCREPVQGGRRDPAPGRCTLSGPWAPAFTPTVGAAGRIAGRTVLPKVPPPSTAPHGQSQPALLLGATHSQPLTLGALMAGPVWLRLETSICCLTSALGPWTPSPPEKQGSGHPGACQGHKASPMPQLGRGPGPALHFMAGVGGVESGGNGV